MNQFTALVWKEWRETRAYLLIGLCIFLGLPIVEGIQLSIGYHRRFEIDAYPWVFALGGVLVMFIAVGSACRDLNGRVEDFWRSRPIGMVRWLLVKYAVGLSVAIAACALPLIVELFVKLEPIACLMLAWYPLFWAAIYSTGFLTGVLLRRPAHAAMLGLASMLLIYFLPVVIPPLIWLNAGTVVDPDVRGVNSKTAMSPWDAMHLHFASGMLVLAIIILAAAITAVVRNWQIASGRRLMYGSVSAVMLILFSSAAFQLGTNLPILQTIDLPADETIFQVRYAGGAGAVISRRIIQRSDESRLVEHRIRRMEFTRQGIKLGNPSPSTIYWSGWWDRDGAAETPGHADIRYIVQTRELSRDDFSNIEFQVVVENICTIVRTSGPKLWQEKTNTLDYNHPRVYCVRDRLYVIGDKLATLDISDPLNPRLISISPSPIQFGTHDDQSKFNVPIPAIPDLSARERLELFVRLVWGGAIEGDTLCVFAREGQYTVNLTEDHLININDKFATFEKVGQYQSSPLESIAGADNSSVLQLQNGLLYASGGWNGRSDVLNQSISVYDTRGAHPMRMAGHFAAPGASVVCPLPDGRALVGGSKLWVVGPPPRMR